MIDHVQDHLEAIYGIKGEERARSFVVNEEVARALGSNALADEELLVHEEDGELGLALYLSPQLLEPFLNLEQRGPRAGDLLGSQLDGYLKIAEGVSHFLYVAQAARWDRHVSLLELEAQAEVDKFAICVLHRWGGSVGAWAEELIGRMFERVSFLPHLNAAERWRYFEANRLARQFCTRLLRHIRARHMDRLLGELRYAYRLGTRAKLSYLAS